VRVQLGDLRHRFASELVLPLELVRKILQPHDCGTALDISDRLSFHHRSRIIATEAKGRACQTRNAKFLRDEHFRSEGPAPCLYRQSPEWSRIPKLP